MVALPGVYVAEKRVMKVVDVAGCASDSGFTASPPKPRPPPLTVPSPRVRFAIVDETDSEDDEHKDGDSGADGTYTAQQAPRTPHHFSTTTPPLPPKSALKKPPPAEAPPPPPPPPPPLHEPGSMEEALAAIEAEDARRAAVSGKKKKKKAKGSATLGGGAVEGGVREVTATAAEARAAAAAKVRWADDAAKGGGRGEHDGVRARAGEPVNHGKTTDGVSGGAVSGGQQRQKQIPGGLVRARRLVKAAASPHVSAALESVFGDGRVTI